MIVTIEVKLSNFDFWSGAKDLASKLTYTELEQIEAILEDIYPDGMNETTINDLFWFEPETICEWLNLDIEDVYNRE